MAAANGNVHEKSWKKAIFYLDLALPGVRKYYSPLSGYLGPLLLQYAETLHHLGRREEAMEAAKESESVMKIIPGTRSHMFSKHYGPRIRAVLAPP